MVDFSKAMPVIAVHRRHWEPMDEIKGRHWRKGQRKHEIPARKGAHCIFFLLLTGSEASYRK
jgi:hypothetical protein